MVFLLKLLKPKKRLHFRNLKYNFNGHSIIRDDMAKLSLKICKRQHVVNLSSWDVVTSTGWSYIELKEFIGLKNKKKSLGYLSVNVGNK